MYPSAFSVRLALQHKIEEWAAKTLCTYFNLSDSVIYAPRNIEFKDYDFVIDLYGTVEVKNDQMCDHTGNIAIEFKKWSKNFTNPRESGIDATIAAHYCICIDRMIMGKKFFEIIFLETDRLREIIASVQPRIVTSNSTCVNPTQCYLLRYNDLKEYSLALFEQNIC
jgi:hypothetical protein